MKNKIVMVAGALALSANLFAVTPEEAVQLLGQSGYTGVVSVTANITVKKGQEKAFEALIPEIKKVTAAEEGNIVVVAAKSLEASNRYTFYGEWGSKEAFREHVEVHAVKMLEKMGPLLDGPPNLSLHKRFK